MTIFSPIATTPAPRYAQDYHHRHQQFQIRRLTDYALHPAAQARASKETTLKGAERMNSPAGFSRVALLAHR